MKIIQLKSLLRVLWFNRFTSFINVFGLSIGIASCLFIYLYVQNELSYDQQHTKKNRIYRVVTDLMLGGEETKSGLSSFMLSPTLKSDYPAIEEAIRVMPVNKQTMWVDEKPFQFKDNLMSEAAFFTIFDYDFIEGDPKTALAEPQSVVITDEVALKMFGTTYGLIGKMIKYARQSYKVTGVVKDVENNSHIYFNTILSLSSMSPQLESTLRNDWFYLAQANYLLFKNEADAIGFEAKLAQLRDKYIVPWLKQVNTEGKITYHLESLTSIHLKGEYPTGFIKTGNKKYIYIFAILALFILLIACINYINLSTATANKRAKEIGVRKTAGANNADLFFQFILESLIIASIAIGIALVWMHLLLPLFNQITDKSLHIPYSWSMLFILLGMAIGIGLLAGSYPAIYLSSLKPSLVLKSNRLPKGFASWIRTSLVVLQFFIAMLFLICTTVIYKQMHFMKNANLGFNKDQVLVVSVPVPDTSFVNKFEIVKQELLQNPQIKSIAITSNIPGMPVGTLLNAIETPDHQRIEKGIDYMFVSHDFLKIMEIPLLLGRDFNKEFVTDDTAAFIINETAVKTYGWKEPLNYTIENGFGHKGKIIGVVKDFNYKSLHEPIQPLVIMVGAKLQGNLLIKVQEGSEAASIQYVEGIWSKYSKRYPMEYFFLDDNFNKQYRNEERMMQLFTIFTIISLLLSCLGLYALVTYNLEHRIKEIGIRKVMGASVKDIVLILVKEYSLLLGIAVLLAVPLAYYFMNKWLLDFASRISLSPWLFILATLATIIIALLTVCIKTIKAASASPVESLRYE